jgi:hypothetical protein
VAADRALDPAVRAAFDAYPPALRAALLDLRRLILETAAATPGVGAVTETLRWKQPSYLTAVTGSGTTIRIDALKGSPDGYALYVNCKTSLVESYKHLYPDSFRYEGQRALLFSTRAPPPEAALRHCIALALTYHRTKAPRA